MKVSRVPFLAIGMAALITGMWSGLLRLGWDAPLPRPSFGLVHGPLMISGFLGTLIGLERGVALGRRWAYGVPALTALGTLALLAGAPHWLAPLLISTASVVLVGIFVVVLVQQSALFTLTMTLGALAWLVGNGIWLGGGEIPAAVSWWLGFLVLTIAGERLELSRLLPVSGRSEWIFLAVVAVVLIGFAMGGIGAPIGARVTGFGLLMLTLWLSRHDVARRTVRQRGLPRYTAICLLSGYVWLAVSGVLACVYGGVIAGPEYDAVLHALLLGFVFTMIFGHAPIIFPAVLGVPIPFRPLFYAHVALLHLSLTLRVVGDIAGSIALRQWGGLLNTLAIVLFLGNLGRAAILGRRARGARQSHARVVAKA